LYLSYLINGFHVSLLENLLTVFSEFCMSSSSPASIVTSTAKCTILNSSPFNLIPCSYDSIFASSIQILKMVDDRSHPWHSPRTRNANVN
jgi:hypothetical protein